MAMDLRAKGLLTSWKWMPSFFAFLITCADVF